MSPRDDQSAASLNEIRSRLRARLAQIGEELRSYPGPIARCDAQLGALIEERTALHAALDDLR